MNADMSVSLSRNGITPVVSIVLLLMMTVAAAGAAYTWFNQIQEDIMGDVDQDLRTSVEVMDLQCEVGDPADPSDDQIRVALKNSGERDIDGGSVDVFVYDSSNELNITATGLNWVNKDFTNQGGFDTATVFPDADGDPSYEQRLYSGEFYSVEIVFTNSGVEVPRQSCPAD